MILFTVMCIDGRNKLQYIILYVEFTFFSTRLIEIGINSFPEIFLKKGMAQEVCRLFHFSQVLSGLMGFLSNSNLTSIIFT